MDIYHFSMPEQLHSEPITFVEGEIKDAVLKTPVQTLVQIKNRPPVLTDEKGQFFLCLPSDKTLEFSVLHDDYRVYRNDFDIPNWDNHTNFKLEIELEPTFVLPTYDGEGSQTFEAKQVEENLYRLIVWFDFNSEHLKLDMQQGIEDFVTTEIGNAEVTSIKIVGFTDGKGSDEYNQVLSEKRARQVSNFLIKQGLGTDDIAVEGRGKAAGTADWENRKVEVFVEVE